VLLALDLQTGRRLALKLITSRRLDSPGTLARLADATGAWSSIQHPNVVALLDHGPVPPDATAGLGARYCLALEYVSGRSLAWYAQTRGPLPIDWSVSVIRDVLAGLDGLHALGLAHEDLRPENVLVGTDGSVKLTDPLLADVLGYSRPDYVSPEQARGEAPTRASDLYAAGILLYDLVADGPPFRGGSAKRVLFRHISELPVSPSVRRPAVPEELARITLRAIEKAPEQRYQDARAFSGALAACRPLVSRGLDSSGGIGRQVSRSDVEVAPTPRPLAPPPRHRIDWRRLGQLSASVLFMMIALALGSGWQPFPTPLSMDQQEGMRAYQATPTRTPLPVPGTPIVIVYEPLFATPSAATATPSPAPTVARTTTPVLPAATRVPAVACSAPSHSNPAIAEAFAALVSYSCGTSLEETVASSIAIALERGTEVRFEQPTSAAWGYYDTSENRITLVPSLATEPVEIRAALLLHELTHARDHFRGGLYRTSGVLGCLDAELRAYQAESAYWRLVRAAGIKVGGPIADDLDSITRQIEKDSSEFVMRDLVNRYGAVCSP